MPEMKTLTIGGYTFEVTDPDAAPADLKTVNAPLMSSIDLLTTADDVTVCPLNAVTYFRAVRPTDGPVVNGDWHVMVRRAHDSDYSRIEVSHVVNGSSYEITKSNGTWGSWVETSASAFAPAGFGLGGDCIYLDNWENATKNGFYYSYSGLPDRYEGYTFQGIAVDYGGYIILNIWQTGADFDNVHLFRKYSKQSQAWGEWEYVNPPMVPGVEYRTTERYNGKPVYCKLMDGGYLPNTGTKYYKVAENAELFSADGPNIRTVSLGGNIPSVLQNDNVVSCFLNGDTICISCGGDRSNLPFKFTAKYTKTTD